METLISYLRLLFHVFHEGLVTYISNVLGRVVVRQQHTFLLNLYQRWRVPLIAMEVQSLFVKYINLKLRFRFYCHDFFCILRLDYGY